MIPLIRHAIDSAATVFAEAGIDTPRHDAEELAAHLAGTDRGRLALLDAPGGEFFTRYRDLVEARRNRVPLQHLTGTAALGQVTLHVGPGVFIPRPETEAMLEWAADRQLPENPLVVDVCTGSGALALALAQRWPSARVIGIDDCDTALGYARRNCAEGSVELRQADVTTPGVLPDLVGQVDLVVANPPYIPDGATLHPEVARHDPAHALFGGADGMSVITAVVAAAGRWLKPGGWFAVEHDDTTSALTVESITGTGFFEAVLARPDLTGRLRFVTARRNGGERHR